MTFLHPDPGPVPNLEHSAAWEAGLYLVEYCLECLGNPSLHFQRRELSKLEGLGDVLLGDMGEALSSLPAAVKQCDLLCPR